MKRKSAFYEDILDCEVKKKGDYFLLQKNRNTSADEKFEFLLTTWFSINPKYL